MGNNLVISYYLNGFVQSIDCQGTNNWSPSDLHTNTFVHAHNFILDRRKKMQAWWKTLVNLKAKCFNIK